MPATVLVGLQWGDEGKGKVIDYLGGKAAWTVRFQGGANAGHTILFDGERFALHLLPAGALREGVRCGLGWGMVVDPDRLIAEIEELEGRGLAVRDRIFASGRATLLLPHHAARDQAEEAGRQGGEIGTTRRGIGPAYEDRVGRNSLLLSDLVEPDGEKRLRFAHDAANRKLAERGGEQLQWTPMLEKWKVWRQTIGPLLADLPSMLHEALERGEEVFFEGGQGTHLDVFAGTFPFVTSSSTLAGGACTGTGLGPTRIDRVVGVAKAYVTRVGAGPFPTEASGAEGDLLRERGAERGTTTGRPRRCGWLDLPLLRAAVRWNGATGIALTKLDVLSGRPAVPVAVAYELDGRRHAMPPVAPSALARVRPIYEEWEGWGEIDAGATRIEELPRPLVAYAERVAREAGAPIAILSTGADRARTIPCALGGRA